MLSVVDGLKFGLDHITPFAWGILGLLAILSTMSWSALLMKWVLLNRTDRANRRFLSGFHESPHPLAIYLTKEQVEMSPLFYLYHAASRELAFHLVGEEEPGRSFSARLQGAGRITPSPLARVILLLLLEAPPVVVVVVVVPVVVMIIVRPGPPGGETTARGREKVAYGTHTACALGVSPANGWTATMERLALSETCV